MTSASTAAAGKPVPDAPRPEREQRGDRDEQRAAGHDHDPRPLVEAAVGHAHAGQRLEPAPHAGEQVAPPVGPQVLVGDAAGEQAERDGGERDHRGDQPAQRTAQPRRPEQGRHDERRDPDRLPRAGGLGRVEQRHPVQPGEGREREQDEAPDGSERQRGIVRGRAHRGTRPGCGERAQAAAPRVMPRPRRRP